MTEEGSQETKTKVDSTGELSDVDNEHCSSSGSGGCGGSGGDTQRTCVDCGTNRTPLWRSGPTGPKSLCNACGIKSRKKRQAALGIKPEEKKRKQKSNISNDLSLDHHRNPKKKVDKEDDHDLKISNDCRKGVSRFLDVGFKVPVMKRSVVGKKRMWRNLGEEERAAMLLMALSYGSVYA